MPYSRPSTQRAAFLQYLLMSESSSDDDDDGDSNFDADGRRKRSKTFRHGGFHPQPRNPARHSMQLLNPQDKWRHPCTNASFGSNWWLYWLDNDLTYDPEGADGLDFAAEFSVPRLIYEDLYDEVKDESDD